MIVITLEIKQFFSKQCLTYLIYKVVYFLCYLVSWLPSWLVYNISDFVDLFYAKLSIFGVDI